MRLLKWKKSKLEMTARKNRQEIIEAGLTRRDLMKMGLLTGAGYLVTKRGLSARAQTSDWSILVSPPTTPWVEPLPLPSVVQPSTLSPAPGELAVPGEAPRAAHQYWSQYLPQKTYELAAQEVQHSFHPDLPLNTVWGWGGSFPGKTVVARFGEPIVVRFRNALPALGNHVGYGRPEVTTHLHNAHTASESDGFPTEFYGTGLFKDNHYLNVAAGFSLPQFGPLGDQREILNTLWYHDHRLDFTAQNVYKGLAGFYLLFDEKDSGDETDTNPNALRLPSGAYDVPLLITDKVFDEDGEVYYDLFNLDGILGDKYVVNGKIQPFFKVARRKYRFRILNGGPSRFLQLSLSNGQSLTQISTDGNLLPAPLSAKSVRMSVAERVDVIIDFSNAQIGDQIFLENRLIQNDGRKPDDKLHPQGKGDFILRFDVDRDAADPSQVPSALRALPPVNMSEVVRFREWDFDRSNGQWTVNGRLFDPNRVGAKVQRNTAEVWEFDGSGGWSHPIHVHMEEFQIRSIKGDPPPARIRGRKDVVELDGSDEVEVFIRFRDFVGRYVMHCHNTLHEDHAMMVRFDVEP